MTLKILFILMGFLISQSSLYQCHTRDTISRSRTAYGLSGVVSGRLTLDPDGGGGDGLAEVVGGAAGVDALVLGPQAGDVQRHVAEVVCRLEPGTWGLKWGTTR